MEVYDEFLRKACLTPEEKDVIRTRVICGWSIQKQAQELGMSVSKVNAITKRLKSKYDEVQKRSNILKPRNKSIKDTYIA
ncbi:MAG: hypothetical protein KBT03_11935 [Bacteroidales bacterium]|nr:hypothetical protein [Candidatus Scybalousia scybalohippi]